jgi:ribose transport system substrate-binding protein
MSSCFKRPLVGAAAACLLAVASTGCGSDNDDAGATAASGGGASTAAASSAAGAKIGYSATFLTDPYQVVLVKNLQAQAKETDLDLLQPTDANNDPAKQITDFQTLLGQGVKGIVTIALNSKAIKPALDRAAAKKVPVVVIDQAPDAGKATMIVKGDTLLMGEQVCEQLGEELGGKGTVLELQGDLGGVVAQERSKGFNDCVKAKYPGISVISKPTEWKQDKATTAAQTILSTNKKVNGVFLASDAAMLPGVVTVLKRLGRLKPAGEAGHVALATIAIKQVKAGIVDAVISQPLPGYAKWGMYYMQQALEGKTFQPGPTDHDSEIVQLGENLADVLKTTVVTKDNADDPALWGNQG